MKRLRPLTLDSNVFISKIKGDERYSDECGADGYFMWSMDC